MESSDLEVFSQALAWLEAGEPAWLVTVIRTWGSSPRPVGAILAVGREGRMAGSISGGCVEDHLIGRIRSGAVATQKPEVITYGVNKEDAARHRIPCGGIIELVVEPLFDRQILKQMVERLGHRELVRRTLNLVDGYVSLAAATRQETLSFDGQVLTSIFGPRWHLILIGANHISRFVAEMALMLDYEVTVVDPREDYLQSWPLTAITPIREMPDDWIARAELDAQTALVALTHDPVLDDLALMEGLRSGAFYVGALGSRVNQARRRERLRQFDLNDTQLDRLHGPVGMSIGSRTPPEIALSILAEMTAAKNGLAQPPKARADLTDTLCAAGACGSGSVCG